MTAKPPPGCIQPSQAKKVLKANKLVGKLTKGIPDVIAYATEQFLIDLVNLATNNGANDLRPEEIARVIQSHPEYQFLSPLLPNVQEAIDEEGSKKRRTTPT
jgi:hypothetical protein